MGEFRVTKTTLSRLFELSVLVACLPSVIRLRLALRVAAEVFVALSASDSILAHAHSCLTAYGLSTIVFLIIIDFSLDDLHYVAAAAFYQISVLC